MTILQSAMLSAPLLVVAVGLTYRKFRIPKPAFNVIANHHCQVMTGHDWGGRQIRTSDGATYRSFAGKPEWYRIQYIPVAEETQESLEEIWEDFQLRCDEHNAQIDKR